jgi:hypothetical protein
METKQKINLILITLMGIVGFCGCAANKPVITGFLSDYSKLKAQSDTSYRYIAPGNKLGKYSKFMIDPVVTHFYRGSSAQIEQSERKLSEKELTELTNYMHDALVKAIEDRYDVVNRPGPGVARMKVAITNLKKSGIVQNAIPIGKLVGTGLGGATLEAEMIDSQSGEQLGAIVESQLGERLSLDGYSTWGDARGIMDRWAKRFRARLDETHGN